VTPTEYTSWQRPIDLYPEHNKPDNVLALYALGLTGEAGEVAEKVKKFYRDRTGIDHKALLKELGDVVWYATAISRWLGYTLQDVMDANVAKLNDRHARGVGHGSGDNR